MKILSSVLLLLLAIALQAQPGSTAKKQKYSVTLGSGITLYSLRDENISAEKYSGTFTPLKISWHYDISDRQFRDIYFSLQKGIVNNFSITSDVNEVTLGWDYGYRLNKGKTYSLFAGPAPFIHFYHRTQVMPAQYSVYSYFGVLSLGAVAGIKSDNAKRFNYAVKGRLALLSLGLNSKDAKESKVLTPFNGLQFHFSALAAYRLLSWADVGLAYGFQTYNITAWDRIYSLSDQFTLNLIFKF